MAVAVQRDGAADDRGVRAIAAAPESIAQDDDAGPDGVSRHPGDIAGQARAVLAIIEQALEEGGFSRHDVVRTRMFITDMAHSEVLSRVHGEVFGEIRPAATMVAVAGLMHPSLLVEIEAEARRG